MTTDSNSSWTSTFFKLKQLRLVKKQKRNFFTLLYVRGASMKRLKIALTKTLKVSKQNCSDSNFWLRLFKDEKKLRLVKPFRQLLRLFSCWYLYQVLKVNLSARFRKVTKIKFSKSRRFLDFPLS